MMGECEGKSGNPTCWNSLIKKGDAVDHPGSSSVDDKTRGDFSITTSSIIAG
jgi:hypothetical protein